MTSWVLHGRLGYRSLSTLMTITLGSFLPLQCGFAGIHLLNGPMQQLSSCAICSLRPDTLSVSINHNWARFLGFICDSVCQAFFIPEDKKVKFAALREDILLSPFVTPKTLQRFSGKVISFSLAIPGCKLHVCDIFKAISCVSGSTQPSIKVEADLHAEIEYWPFLDHWKDCLPWRTELHTVVTLYCDA